MCIQPGHTVILSGCPRVGVPWNTHTKTPTAQSFTLETTCVQQELDVNRTQLSGDRAHCDPEADMGTQWGVRAGATGVRETGPTFLEEGEQRGWSCCRNVLTLGAHVREVY